MKMMEVGWDGFVSGDKRENDLPERKRLRKGVPVQKPVAVAS
jgi:hypothetical protein